MRSLIVGVAVVSFAVLLPATGHAYCSEPSFYGSEPSSPSYFAKPSVPYCLSSYSYSGRHSCDDWEIDAYFDEVNDYIRELQEYVDDAQSFANEAIDYADQALDYAKCEAEDVKHQHGY